MFYLLIIIAIILTLLFKIPFLDFLKSQKLVKKNYLGEKIPTGYGLLVAFNFFIILYLGLLFEIYNKEIIINLYLLIIMVVLAGIIDDFFEQQNKNGFYGHFSLFFTEGKISSGLLKAVLISFAAFLISFEMNDNLFELLIDFMLIVLSANFINLLDLRPGRAIKSFIILALFILIGVKQVAVYLLPLIVILLIILPLDLKAKIMIGDLGANFLGSMLGFSLVVFANLETKVLIVIFLVIIHLYTEKFSLTAYIKRNKILNYIDFWGRERV